MPSSYEARGIHCQSELDYTIVRNRRARESSTPDRARPIRPDDSDSQEGLMYFLCDNSSAS